MTQDYIDQGKELQRMLGDKAEVMLLAEEPRWHDARKEQPTEEGLYVKLIFVDYGDGTCDEHYFCSWLNKFGWEDNDRIDRTEADVTWIAWMKINEYTTKQ